MDEERRVVGELGGGGGLDVDGLGEAGGGRPPPPSPPSAAGADGATASAAPLPPGRQEEGRLGSPGRFGVTVFGSSYKVEM